MPKPKILWIDGVGSYAMCDSDEVSIGQAFPGNDVDLAIRGDLSLENQSKGLKTERKEKEK